MLLLANHAVTKKNDFNFENICIFSQNPAQLHRLIPFLNRELNVLLESGGRTAYVMEKILDLLPMYSMQSVMFKREVARLVGHQYAPHFCHELRAFASSAYDLVHLTFFKLNSMLNLLTKLYPCSLLEGCHKHGALLLNIYFSWISDWLWSRCAVSSIWGCWLFHRNRWCWVIWCCCLRCRWWRCFGEYLLLLFYTVKQWLFCMVWQFTLF